MLSAVGLGDADCNPCQQRGSHCDTEACKPAEMSGLHPWHEAAGHVSAAVLAACRETSDTGCWAWALHDKRVGHTTKSTGWAARSGGWLPQALAASSTTSHLLSASPLADSVLPLLRGRCWAAEGGLPTPASSAGLPTSSGGSDSSAAAQLLLPATAVARSRL